MATLQKAAISLSAIATALTVSPVATAQDTSPSTPQPDDQITSVAPGEVFDIPLDDNSEGGVDPQFGVGSCEGWIDGPKHKSDDRIYYGVNVSCQGSGFLPLYAQAKLQEEHVGIWYQDVDDTGKKRLSEGGYGYAGTSVECGNSTGHDYRVEAHVWAGDHHQARLSDEVFLKCNV